MVVSTKFDDTLCPVARSQAVMGDRWTIVIMRELFMGNRRFDDLMVQSQATPQMLTLQLRRLEANGLVERHPYTSRPPRYEYQLTAKGLAFYPVIRALREWGETWCKSENEDIAVRYKHLKCGGNAGLGMICETCGNPVRREDLKAKLSPSYARERKKRQAE
jgi:DNA-binding HxlR family transcriptional regulator